MNILSGVSFSPFDKYWRGFSGRSMLRPYGGVGTCIHGGVNMAEPPPLPSASQVSLCLGRLALRGLI